MKLLLTLAFLLLFSSVPPLVAQSIKEVNSTAQLVRKIIMSRQINPTTVEVIFADSLRMTIDFYGENIFRVFQDNKDGIIRDPQAKPEARILVDSPRRAVSLLNINEGNGVISIGTSKVQILLDKNTSLMKVVNLKTNAIAFEETAPILFDKEKVSLFLKENSQEYFYGGGVQNGRFSHKGKVISIENQNSWTDGGVASPNPFYWSTNGYGMMWYTFEKGKYDFGTGKKGVVTLSHDTNYLDVFFMVNDGAVPLLNDFYQLTGNPVLLPKFGFYEGHLNAYNRDYWQEDEKGILFEDGKRYKESQKDNSGIKESLNGEKSNYQFSARAVIDRYKSHDMPFGWLLPNDGYGAGYGQTGTLDGNIQNLKNLADYAHKNGVEIGLWTQSDLHPKPEISALLQRDIIKEVRDAGVRVLKTDVAWVGAGYSFGLNGVADVGHTMSYYGNNARPFIISLDGWAGTQRYATIWSGDQTGGEWEYIRFHIPTYIGSGLSGQPNICSDVDGIFGGKNPTVNTRDFQWKTFSSMQLNMDGWGANEKYPHAFGEPVTSINRWYLKLKSELIPYTYSFAKKAVDGMPLIRAMFLEYPNAYTLGTSTQYQFLYGTDFLVAPIYQATKADAQGNDIRNGIYLPEGEWIDYFTGEKYEGNRILNNFDTPLWKLPVFVKNGAIIPMTHPNNNVSEINKNLRIYEIYPKGHTSMTEYDDDGVTEDYKQNKGTTTLIESNVGAKNKLTVTVSPTQGDFNGFVKEKATEFRINVTAKPKKVVATIRNSKVKLMEVASMEEFLKGENVYFYDAAPNLNKFATKGSEFEKVVITKNPQFLVKLASTNTTANQVEIMIEGFIFAPADKHRISTGTLVAPVVQIAEENAGAYTLKPTWKKVDHADFYDVEFNGMLYTTIKDTELLFDGLSVETDYSFKMRAVNKEGYSDWTQMTAKTKPNPLEFAIHNIKGEVTAKHQGGAGINRLLDFNESGNVWHTKYGENALPFEMILDLRTVNQLDKFHYLPRVDGGNGTLLKGIVYYSMDKVQWIKADTFEWERSGDMKVFPFASHPVARYIKLAVTNSVGNYGSGRELYVFKVPGTESYLQGDINADGKIDANDLTSYMNYTGLKKGDADFAYISKGDINNNGLVDAYDISVVTTQLESGVDESPVDTISGDIAISASKKNYNEGDLIEIQVKGKDLKSINALSFALPYDQQAMEYVGVKAQNMKAMENLTYDRLHTDGSKVLYPTFVNVGSKESLGGTADLFILTFKAKRKIAVDLKIQEVLLIDKNLNCHKL